MARASRFGSSKLTLDHVVPKSHGGGKGFTNMVATCESCNSRRGNTTKIQPKQAPYRPTYHELVAKRRALPITIPHASWLPYIGWDESMVTILPPHDMPGYMPDSKPERLLRALLSRE